MARLLKSIFLRMMLILPVSLALGVATYPAIATAQTVGMAQTTGGLKYPLVTLEIPPLINEIGAPSAILASLQQTVIDEIKKKNLYSDVLPGTDVLDGVLTIQGTVVSWDEADGASQTEGAPGAGTLTVELSIFQKIVPCPLNRAVVTGEVSPTMLASQFVQSDHALVKGLLAFLSSVTGDE